MMRTSRWLWLPLSLFLVGPVAAQKVPGNKPPDKKEAENKLVKAGKIAGELVHIEPSKHSFRLKVTYRYAEVNQGALRGYLQAQQQLAQARSLQQIQQAQQSMLQNQANLYTFKSASKEFPIEAAEKCEVRLPAPKQAFDDMGNVKKLSAKELAALRGKDRMFDGEFSDLTTGQIVEVTLVSKKLPRGAKKEDLEENKPQASRIAVLMQPRPRP
jgi:hypothetical protein